MRQQPLTRPMILQAKNSLAKKVDTYTNAMHTKSGGYPLRPPSLGNSAAHQGTTTAQGGRGTVGAGRQQSIIPIKNRMT